MPSERPIPTHGTHLTRRRFALALPLLGALPWALPGPSNAASPQRASRTLMGTRVDLVVDHGDGPQAQAAMTLAFAEMQRLQDLLSRYHEGSIVQRLSAAAGRQPIAVPPEAMAVLQSAARVFQKSNGAFDPTVGALAGWHFEPGHQAMPSPSEIRQALPHVNGRALQLDARAQTAYLTQAGMALDLGGIAKLPILAAGLQVLQREGIRNALINGGGDVLTLGRLQGRPWRVGVRDPRAPAQLLGVIELDGTGVVASSGDYERGFVNAGRRLHHVLDPRTGWPTTGVPGVALLARHVDEVNGWGTALMVQGPQAAPAWAARHRQASVLVASHDGALWQSSGMRAALRAS